jgi:hypothetical protein
MKMKKKTLKDEIEKKIKIMIKDNKNSNQIIKIKLNTKIK